MKRILILLIISNSLNIYSQDEKEAELPIIFGEVIFGGAGKIKGSGGILFGAELNYQNKKDLFTIRYLENPQLKKDVVLLTPFTPFPVWKEIHNNKEMGLLYGKRWIFGGTSLSLSGGVSWNIYSSKLTDENDEDYTMRDTYFGFPFEVNFKLFKSKKTRYRVFYALIPVGKPTAFGRNFGLKLVGNISKNSFLGLGLVFGLGIHRKY